MARLSRMARLAAGFTIFTSTMNVATARTQEHMFLVFELYLGLELWGGACRGIIPRVPQCLSPCLNRVRPAPIPSPTSESVLPLEPKGGGHSPAFDGVGGPNSDDWRESLALCLLCENVTKTGKVILDVVFYYGFYEVEITPRTREWRAPLPPPRQKKEWSSFDTLFTHMCKEE
jgi:hypothetical protein